MTHIVLAKATEDLLRGALKAAWQVRAEANTNTARRRPASKPRRTTRKGVT